MTNKPSEWVDMSELRIGLFVDLDLGWMAHPFPSNRFKISNLKQIEIIRSLGLQQVRCVLAKSDPLTEPSVKASPSTADQKKAVVLKAMPESLEAQAQRSQRVQYLETQRQNLIFCERRFGEGVREYRQVMERVMTQPEWAGEQCQKLVQSYVGDMACEGEVVIRLLSQSMGDRVSTHPVNVTVLSLLLGRALSLSPLDMVDLGVAAALHDMGKLALPDRVHILEDGFSAAEFKQYQTHVDLGVDMGRRMALSPGVLTAIAQHHELDDGSGFPMHARGDQLSVPSKILALVNRYENLCNPGRPETAMTPHESLALIFSQLRAQFDGPILGSFIRMMGIYPPGSVLEFLDGRHALVVSVNSSRPLRPRVIVYDRTVPKTEALILDLEQCPEISIRRSIKPSSLPSDALQYFLPRKRICYYFERSIDLDVPGEAS